MFRIHTITVGPEGNLTLLHIDENTLIGHSQVIEVLDERATDPNDKQRKPLAEVLGDAVGHITAAWTLDRIAKRKEVLAAIEQKRIEAERIAAEQAARQAEEARKAEEAAKFQEETAQQAFRDAVAAEVARQIAASR